jgi:uncharacterized protein (TIGR00251 family)
MLEAARIEVRVQPKSGRNDVVPAGDGKLKVYVTAAPERGKANEAAISLLAARLGVAKGRISILRGHRSKNKVMLIEGLDARAVLGRLDATP